MKLIKMQPDMVQIKSNDKDFEKCHLNDLIKISDGVIDLVTMVVSLTDTDPELPISDDVFLDQIGIPSVKNIECSIIGSIVNGKFTNSIDKYPTTDVTAEIMTDKEFEKMLTKENGSSFKLGNYANYDCSAMIDGNKFYQRHSCIVGNTGSGKSETVTKIMEETAKNTNCNIVVFDIHGEYSRLSYVDNIKVGKEFPFPVWMLGFSNMASNILKIKEESATVLMSALRKSYKLCCKNGNEGKPVYYDFEKLLSAMNTLNNEYVGTGEFYASGAKAGQEKMVKGDFNGKLSSIINTMENVYNDKRFSFLFVDETQSYLNEVMDRIMGDDKKVKNIDLSEVPHDIAILIIGVIAKLIYNIQIMQKSEEIVPITLVCDEAHVYIPVDFQLSMMKGVMADGSSGVIETTTMFFPGDALVIGDCIPIPLKVHVDLAEERPCSKTINFWDEWKQRCISTQYGKYVEDYLKD